MHEEVIVVGLGAVGSYATLKLAKRGANVVGLESDDLVHPRAAYAGESRLFRAAYHEGAEYLPLLLDSREQWLQLESQGDRPLFRPTGVLSIGSSDAPQMSQVQRSLEQGDVPHEVLTSSELRRRFPQHAEITDEIGVLDLLGGVLHPEASVAEIQRQALEHGAALRGGARVTSLSEQPDHVAVELNTGELLRAQKVVVTAGVHTPALLPELAPSLTIKPISLTWFCPDRPADFHPDVFPAFIRDLGDLHIFGVPTLDGTLVKAGYDAKLGSIEDPDALPSELTLAQRDSIRNDVSRLLRGVPPHIARESLHMDIYTDDKRPILGPSSERIVVGTGYSGHGFKLTPAFGDAIASFTLDEVPEHDMSRFLPGRFLP